LQKLYIYRVPTNYDEAKGLYIRQKDQHFIVSSFQYSQKDFTRVNDIDGIDLCIAKLSINN
jgi:hypothetical protein